tara:strand:- start:129 stop:479 length:351 start_codon:yes stop_codon:yes gene_type:complete
VPDDDGLRAKFVPRAAAAKHAADGLRAAAARAALNMDDDALGVEYANGEQGQQLPLSAANIGGGGFKIPKVKGQPTRAPGPYMIFCKAERSKVVAANPSMAFGEVSSVLSSGHPHR